MSFPLCVYMRTRSYWFSLHGYACRVEYKTGAETVSKKLYDMLTGIQTGRIEDKMGWTVEID